MDKFLLLIIAIMVGLLGDLSVQALNRFSPDKNIFGLAGYFAQHGVLESAFIAAGVMGFFYSLYLLLDLPLTVPALALYGALVDLFGRYSGILPTLSSYYQQPVYATTIMGGVVPFVLPLLILCLLGKAR